MLTPLSSGPVKSDAMEKLASSLALGRKLPKMDPVFGATFSGGCESRLGAR